MDNDKIMRAKLKVVDVKNYKDNQSYSIHSEQIKFAAVCPQKFDNEGNALDGDKEDADYARWTPTCDLNISITNPSLFNKFEKDQVFYVDFMLVNTKNDEEK